MKKGILALIVLAASGCHMMIGTPSGIREMGKWHNGLVTTGKASPDVADAYWRNQETESKLKLFWKQEGEQ